MITNINDLRKILRFKATFDSDKRAIYIYDVDFTGDRAWQDEPIAKIGGMVFYTRSALELQGQKFYTPAASRYGRKDTVYFYPTIKSYENARHVLQQLTKTGIKRGDLW